MCINRKLIPEDDGPTDLISSWVFWTKSQRPNLSEMLSEQQSADTKQQVWQHHTPISESNSRSKAHLELN